MPDWYALIRTPNIQLILGIISFFAAVFWTCTGKVWARFHGWVYRTKEPRNFGWAVAMYYFIGIFLIGYFLTYTAT